MTPKEKAEELVERFKKEKVTVFFTENSIPSLLHAPMINKSAKQCALICVDEVLQSNPIIKGTSDDLITMIVQTKAYWYEVKQEIEKL